MNLNNVQKKSNVVGDPFADILGGSSQPQFGGQQLKTSDPFASAFGGNPGGFTPAQNFG